MLRSRVETNIHVHEVPALRTEERITVQREV